jgi:mono/diheme cytochrome c family protein
MRRALHLSRGIVALLPMLASFGACAAASSGAGAAASSPAMASADASPDLIRRGEYLATAGDCAACHTAPGGKAFAGGLPIPTPVGDIVSTNITPSKRTGIGDYTFEQFTAALRLGIRGDGRRLYPAMPYTSYAKVTDDDAHALYAYFMHGVAPVDSKPPPTNLPFPFDIRLSMAVWNALFLDPKPYTPDPARGAEWNRGAYLARGLAHCSTCHTPRNLLMAEDLSRALGGGDVGAWTGPNITSDANSGVGGWSVPELVGYLREGHAAGKSQAAGPMAEAVDQSLRHLSDADLRAMATYLKTVPALRDAADTRPVYAWGDPADDLPSIRGVALPQDPSRMTGPQLYDAWCSTCHQARAEGSFGGGLPALFHNTALGRANTNDLAMVVLDGLHRNPDVFMPGFARELSDQQIATLGSYLLQRYGNPAGRVTLDQVKQLRAGGAPSHLVLAARLGLAGVAVVIIAAVVAFAMRRRRRAR